MHQEMMREVYRHVGEMAGEVSQSPDISSSRDGVGGSRTGTGTVPIPQMKVEIPKYRDGFSIHLFFLVYKTSIMTPKIPSEQWGSYLSSSLSGEAWRSLVTKSLMNSYIIDDVILTICRGRRSRQRVSGGLIPESQCLYTALGS